MQLHKRIAYSVSECLTKRLAYEAAYGQSKRFTERLAYKAAHRQSERLAKRIANDFAAYGQPELFPNGGANESPLYKPCNPQLPKSAHVCHLESH